MPLSAAEKQKRYRERLKNNPEKYLESKRKHRERYHKNKRLVKDLTPKEKYNANVIWRLRKRELKKKKQIIERLLQNTPPTSPRPDSQLNISKNTPPPLLDNPLIAVQIRSTPFRSLRSTSDDHNALLTQNVLPPLTVPTSSPVMASVTALAPVSSAPLTTPIATPLSASSPVPSLETNFSSLACSTADSSQDSMSSSFLVEAQRTPLSTTPLATSSSAKERGRKRVKKNRSKVYRENEKLKEENKKLKKKYEKYKKRHQRNKEKEKKTTKNEDLRYKVLSCAIKKTFKSTKSRKEKQVIKKIFSSVEINDSRMKKKLLKENLGVDKIVKQKYCLNRVTLLKKKINAFYNRDDITRPTAGKKDTVTKNGKKEQKRYLMDTMKNLHKTFKKENPELHCSYFYFTRNKPFYVVNPTVDARDMCQCKAHTNFGYKAKALKKKGITNTDNPDVLIESTVCDVNAKECMYGFCDNCKNKKYDYNIEKANGMIGWTEWIRKVDTYEKDGKAMKAMKNVREELSEDAKDFIKRYERDLAAFKKHIFNIKSQFRNFRRCLEHIQPDECVIVADFSENYNCKYHEEIQHHHFAGSRNQISLHTVVVYAFDDRTPQGYKANSFCTVSASNIHQPAAIWTHLDPVLNWIRSEFPGVNTVHFYSDGPSTQYRQKQNFYLMCTKLFDYGFDAMTWSFFESGHGKGPADGVGGYLKRTADQIVANGEDIPDVQQFYEKLHNISKIKLFLINEKAIQEFHQSLPTNIPRLVGTFKVHQVFSNSYGTMKFRELSCFCENGLSGKRGFCMCMAPKNYDVKIACGIDTNNEHIEPVVDVPEATLETGGSSDVQSTVDVSQVHLETPGFSDDDDEPLATLKFSKELEDITNKRRKSIYKEVYGDSTDDEQPCSSYGKENSKIGKGDFLLVNVYVDSTKKKTYIYACKTLDDIEEDGEIKVMFLRVVDKNAKRFRLDANDVCYVDYEDVIKKLPNPNIVKRGQRTYYEFKNTVDVFEK